MELCPGAAATRKGPSRLLQGPGSCDIPAAKGPIVVKKLHLNGQKMTTLLQS